MKQAEFIKKQDLESNQLKSKFRFFENNNPIDIISVDVPLMIRLLEYAREDANTDLDLHYLTENLIKMSKGGNTLTMSHYKNIIDNIKNVAEDASAGSSCSASIAASPTGNLFANTQTHIVKRKSAKRKSNINVGQGIY